MPSSPKNYPFYNWVPKPVGIIILFVFFLPIPVSYTHLKTTIFAKRISTNNNLNLKENGLRN